MGNRYFINTDKTALETAREEYEIVKVANDALDAAYHFLVDRYRTVQNPSMNSGHEIENVISRLYESQKHTKRALVEIKDRYTRVELEAQVLTDMGVDEEVAEKIIRSGLFELDIDTLQETQEVLSEKESK